MTLRKSHIFTGLAGLLFATVGYGLVGISGEGTWPESWPKALDVMRAKSKTLEVAHGIQETQYEIRFEDCHEFEKAWPHILSLKSPGARLILERAPSTSTTSGSTLDRGVRILCPAGISVSETSDGTTSTLTFSTPWPESVLINNRELPEYAVHEQGKWIAWTGQESTSFRYRVRTDIVLVVDGSIIDLNKVELPSDIPVIDRRFGTKL